MESRKLRNQRAVLLCRDPVLVCYDAIHGNGFAIRLLCTSHCLDDPYFTGRPVLRLSIPAANVSAEFLDICQALTRLCSLQRCHDLASYYHTIGNLGNTDEVVPSANTKSNRGRLIAAIFLDTFEEGREVCVEGTQGTGYSLSRHDVDEGVGQLA
jgi:hypothetical protein